MSVIKVGYINILETSVVTVTTEDSDYPAYRLYDRAISRLYKGTSTAEHTIKTDQQGNIRPVNGLFIPSGHNLNGAKITLEYSMDDSTWVSAVPQWTQSGNGQIFKEFSAVPARYWRTVITDASNPPAIPEYYLTYLYTFTCKPSYGATRGMKHNVSRGETKAGVPYYLSKGESRKRFAYQLKNISPDEKDEMVSWISSWGGYKPFVFVLQDYADTAIALPSDNDLAAYWPFNENSGTSAYDSSGNGHNGALNNMDDSNWANGCIGPCLSFNGQDEVITTSCTPPAPITLSAFIYINGYPPGTGSDVEGYILRSGNAAYFSLNSAGKLSFYIYNNGQNILLSSQSLSKFTWYHVAAVWDGTTGANSQKIYINGVLNNSNSAISTSYQDNTSGFTIGAQNATYNHFNGKIDDVRIYNKALSADDTKALYLYSKEKVLFAELTQDIMFSRYFNRFMADVSVMEVLG